MEKRECEVRHSEASATESWRGECDRVRANISRE